MIIAKLGVAPEISSDLGGPLIDFRTYRRGLVIHIDFPNHTLETVKPLSSPQSQKRYVMDIKSEAENLMPSALTRWLWWSSIGLSAILYKFYPDLPKAWLPQTEEVYFLTRLLLSGSVLLLGSLSLVILLARHDKKMRLQNAELKSTLDVVSTDSNENAKSNKTLRSQLATTVQELGALKKSYAEKERVSNERKFLLDVAEKKLADLSKPIEPASASSAPGPNDYHAPRKRLIR